MKPLGKKLWPSLPDLIAETKAGFAGDVVSLPPNFEKDLPALVEEALTDKLLSLIRFGLKLILLLVVVPLAGLALATIPPEAFKWPLVLLVLLFFFLGFAFDWMVSVIPRTRLLSVIFLLGILGFFGLGFSAVYYLEHMPDASGVPLAILLVGAPAVIPPFIGSHRRLFVVIAGFILPMMYYFGQTKPDLWPVVPCLGIYFVALLMITQVDNIRRKKSIILNYFLLALKDSYSVMNNELALANNSYERAIDEENRMKTIQDSDYALTSGLIKPLAGGEVTSDSYEIRTYSRAKTNFSYQDSHTELGGDLNIVDAVHIDDRRFLVLLNSDAMGKSMQGAGGALVLGTTFRMLLDRCKTGDLNYSTPQEWIEEAVRELNDVFFRFEGTMLISLVLGLVEEATGKLFFTNVEHPFSVSLHQGKASYIEKEVGSYKLGTWYNAGKTTAIIEYQIKLGELFVTGSDGRDDLTVNGEILPDDSKRFLGAVEAAGNDLTNLAQKIRELGKPKDDMSFVSVYRKK